MYNSKETVRKTLENNLTKASVQPLPIVLKGEKHNVNSFLLALELQYGKKG